MVSDIPAGDRKIANLFLTVYGLAHLKVRVLNRTDSCGIIQCLGFFFLNCFIEVKQGNEIFTVTRSDLHIIPPYFRKDDILKH